MSAAVVAIAQPALHLKGLKRDRTAPALDVSTQVKSRTLGRSHVVVQFGSNPSDDQLKELQNRGAAVLSYVPDFAVSISADDDIVLDGLDIRSTVRLKPEEKISPDLAEALAESATVAVLVEFYPDVDPNDGRAIVNEAGLLIRESADLLAHHLLVTGSSEQVWALAAWDEVAYIFPASVDVIEGRPAHACAGAVTAQGQVGQSVALVGDGWDGPGLGGADLRYAFVHVTDVVPADAAESEIVRAFHEWAKHAKLTFTAGSSTTESQTVAVLFASGDHGDGYPFDGPRGVLAHTFYPFPVNREPVAGDMHFDNDESWKIGADVDLFSIALHEAGHALGLGHSDKPGAVMYPYYHKVDGLTPDDIAAVLQLYAPQDGTPAPDPGKPTLTPANPLALTVQAPASPTTAGSAAISGTTTGGVGAVQVTWATNYGYAGTAASSANWSISAIPLKIGDNVITITARDSQQNQVTRSVTITRQPPENPPATADTTAPSLAILSPATTNFSTSATSLVVTGTARDNVGIIAVTWSSSNGDSGSATGTANWATAPIPLYVGTTAITIRAKDAAGNTAWRSITVTRR
jgi:hypothetical protein